MDPTSHPRHRSTSHKDILASALPSDFKCKIRYIRTPPKSCDPLFSPPPGREPEKTRLASHFLTISLAPTATAGSSILITPYLNNQSEGVFALAVEVLVYTTKHITTLFVSKADTTGFLPNSGPSKTKIIVTTFLQWLVLEQRKKRSGRKVVVSLFARAQNQYLFPGSIENDTKKPLDDRKLIKWWVKVLDPLFDQQHQADLQADPPDTHGYVTIPGYDANELRAYFPTTNVMPNAAPRWKAGDPLTELAETRGVLTAAPPRALLPRFPDDPKGRFIVDLDQEVGLAEDARTIVSPSKRKSGRWNNITDLKRFWEAMEFRQECSSGRVVGFLWLVITPSSTYAHDEDGYADSQDSQPIALSSDPLLDRDSTPTPTASPAKRNKRPLRGPIIPRQPRLKRGSSSTTATGSSLNNMLDGPAGDGLLLSKDGYDRAMETLLHLDFAGLEVAARSTTKWVQEVCSISGLSADWAMYITGTAPTSVVSIKSAGSGGGTQEVNQIGSIITKKRKATDAESGAAEKPAVNVLSGGMVRKKVKSSS